MRQPNIVPIDTTVLFNLASSLVKATQTLTSDATNPDAAGTITLGAKTYTLVANLTAAVAASGVLTSDDTQVTAGKKVTVASQIYTFVEALTVVSGPRQYVPNEVLIGADADATMDNLRAAINGTIAGLGSTYSLGTVANPEMSAGTLLAHAFTVTARTTGTVGNAYAKAEDDAHLDWDGSGAVMTGGVDTVANQIKIGASAAVTLDNIKSAVNGTAGAGTTYSVGTTANEQVTATTNADTTQVFEAITGGVAGNSIASTEDATHLSFGATALAGGSSTKGQYTFTDSGFAHRFITILGDITGTGTVLIALYNAAGTLLKSLVAAQAQSSTSDTAYEVEIAAGDYILFTASAAVSDADSIKLSVR